VPQVGIINPGEMSPANSIEIAMWAAVGGRGSLIGPVVGAFSGQRCQELAHRDSARILVVFPRCFVHCCDLVLASRCGGLGATRCERRSIMTPDLMKQGAQRVAGA
jgi:hypothetical protein